MTNGWHEDFGDEPSSEEMFEPRRDYEAQRELEIQYELEAQAERGEWTDDPRIKGIWFRAVWDGRKWKLDGAYNVFLYHDNQWELTSTDYWAWYSPINTSLNLGPTGLRSCKQPGVRWSKTTLPIMPTEPPTEPLIEKS